MIFNNYFYQADKLKLKSFYNIATLTTVLESSKLFYKKGKK